jgi:starvation-inducible DNA-binding protein
MKTDIGIADKDRKAVAGLLDALLADEYVLYTKTRNYHWNVTGMSFNDLHKFFEAQYEELDEIIDEVAERSRALGARALGSLRDFLKETRLGEDASVFPEAKAMLRGLLGDHEAVIRTLRKDLETAARHGDAGTSDFLTGLMERHEKMAWMLRSFLGA